MKTKSVQFFTFMSFSRLGLYCSIVAAIMLFGLTQASAQISIGFEQSEGYPAAPSVFTATSGSNSSTAALPFGLPSGNAQGWTPSSSTNAGQLVVTASSGLYAGGQALASSSASQSYIGAKNLSLSSGFTSVTFDGRVTSATVSQDNVSVAGWADVNSDGMYTQGTEFGPQGGILTGTFGIRLANFGTTSSSGVAATVNNWYHMTLTLNFATNTASLDVTDLTNGGAVISARSHS